MFSSNKAVNVPVVPLTNCLKLLLFRCLHFKFRRANVEQVLTGYGFAVPYSCLGQAFRTDSWGTPYLIAEFRMLSSEFLCTYGPACLKVQSQCRQIGGVRGFCFLVKYVS